MQLRNRYYTYPVIEKGNESYIESSFETDAEVLLEGYNIKLKLSAILMNRELEEKLDKGTVIIVHHIECPQTCYRKVHRTKQREEEFLIMDKEVNGLLQVCTFLVANEDLEKYSNELFSNDFKGFRFDIDKGCVLAVGNQVNLKIDKIRDDLENTTSIFSVQKNLDETATEMKVNLSQNKIVVLLPDATYARYENMSGYMEVQPVMHSMLIIPALQYTINELQKSIGELYQYEDNRWFRGLRKSCANLGYILDETNIKSYDSLELSQKLINAPINDAVLFLSIGGGSYED